MKNRFEFLLGAVLLTLLACLAVVWVYNLNKLMDCDFEADYKCEVVHAAGVIIPPVSVVTVWFDIDPAKIVD